MLSVILSRPDSNEVSLSGLQNVAVTQRDLVVDLVLVDAHTALLDESLGVASALGKAGLDQRAQEILWIPGDMVGDLVRELPFAKFGVEVGLSAHGRLFTVQT